MQETEHQHKWETLSHPDKLLCSGCQTVTDIKTLIHNVTVEVTRATKVELYIAQLYAKDLKKSAHDKAYAWVLQNSPSIVVPAEDKQEVLL